MKRNWLLSVVLVLCSFAFAEQPPRPLLERKVLEEVAVADYSAASSAKVIHPQSSVAVENGTLKISLPARTELPAVQLWSGAGLNISKMDMLRFEVENTGPSRATVWLYVYDSSEKKRAAFNLPLDQGKNVVALPLWFVLCE